MRAGPNFVIAGPSRYSIEISRPLLVAAEPEGWLPPRVTVRFDCEAVLRLLSLSSLFEEFESQSSGKEPFPSALPAARYTLVSSATVDGFLYPWNICSQQDLHVEQYRHFPVLKSYHRATDFGIFKMFAFAADNSAYCFLSCSRNCVSIVILVTLCLAMAVRAWNFQSCPWPLLSSHGLLGLFRYKICEVQYEVWIGTGPEPTN